MDTNQTSEKKTGINQSFQPGQIVVISSRFRYEHNKNDEFLFDKSIVGMVVWETDLQHPESNEKLYRVGIPIDYYLAQAGDESSLLIDLPIDFSDWKKAAYSIKKTDESLAIIYVERSKMFLLE